MFLDPFVQSLCETEVNPSYQDNSLWTSITKNFWKNGLKNWIWKTDQMLEITELNGHFVMS